MVAKVTCRALDLSLARAFCQNPLMTPRPGRNVTPQRGEEADSEPASSELCWLFVHRRLFILVFSPHYSLSHLLLLAVVARRCALLREAEALYVLFPLLKKASLECANILVGIDSWSLTLP